MNFGTKIVKAVFGVFSEQIHGRQRCYAQLSDILSEEQTSRHIYDRIMPRRNDKLIRSGNARA